MPDTTEERPSKKYSFDSSFQSKIVALSLRDDNFLRRTDGLIKPEYFEDLADAHIVNMCLEYFKKYKKAPVDLAIIKQLFNDAREKKIIRDEYKEAVGEKIVRAFKGDLSSRDFVVEKVSDFARHQAVSNAIYEVVEKHLDFNDFDVIQDKLNKALMVGASGQTVGVDLFENIDARTAERIEIAEGKAPKTGITTGYPELDNILQTHGGWGRKELSMLMGAAKVGKSTALMDFALRACVSLQHFNVLYVTLEVSQGVIFSRCDAHLSGVSTKEMKLYPNKVRDEVKFAGKKAGKFICEEYPPGTFKVSDLRRVLEKYKSEGLVFDLVVIDYADLMSPDNRSDNEITNSKNIWTALRAVAVMENVAILTATQTNREGMKRAVATITDVADDINKARIADVNISINKTEEDKALNQCRLFMAALRNDADGFSLIVEQDIEKMRFIKRVIGVA